MCLIYDYIISLDVYDPPIACLKDKNLSELTTTNTVHQLLLLSTSGTFSANYLNNKTFSELPKIQTCIEMKHQKTNIQSTVIKLHQILTKM